MAFEDWDYYVEITVQSSQVDADLTDFPVYVDLSDMPAGFFSNVKSDGSDIRVTKSDGTTEIAREVVAIDTGASTGELHFVADGTLSSSSNTTFRIYYGNAAASEPAATATYGSQNVWDSNFKGVWHMQESSGNLLDSTASGANMSPMGSPNQGQPGAIGKSVDFVPTDYLFVNDSDLNITNTTTVSAIVNLDAAGSVARSICEWGVASGGRRRGLLMRNTEQITFITNSAADGNTTSTLTPGTWTHLAGTASDTANTSEVFFNGTSEVSSTPTLSSFTYAGTYIGANIVTTEPWDGKIDEVRISNIIRSDQYVSTEYNNLMSPGSFYSVGAQESNGSGPLEQPAIFFGACF